MTIPKTNSAEAAFASYFSRAAIECLALRPLTDAERLEWIAKLLALDQRKKYPRPRTWLRGFPSAYLLYVTTPHNRPSVIKIHHVR